MAYTKQTWNNGDVISADKLNHIEDGVANGAKILQVTATTSGVTTTLDKTWEEINSFIHNGGLVFVVNYNSENLTSIGIVISVGEIPNDVPRYSIGVSFINGTVNYVCNSMNDLPYFYDGD